jgi:hypothetical protein
MSGILLAFPARHRPALAGRYPAFIHGGRVAHMNAGFAGG